MEYGTCNTVAVGILWRWSIVLGNTVIVRILW